MSWNEPIRAVLLLTVLLTTSGCGDGDDVGPPRADLSERLEGGGGPFIAAGDGLEVPDGYVVEEYVAAGTATDYRAEGGQGDDGLWTFVPDTTAEYRTRVLVRRPADPAEASGTVIVEWLNVSGGVDAEPVYTNLAAEIARQGHIWVGVSAQMIGVEGGASLLDDEAVGLVALDAERYGSLAHPGDGYSFDIFTQVARTIRAGGAPVGGIEPDILIAAGQSQSAFALTTYYDGVQPLTDAFDGFYVQSRAAAALPLANPGQAVSITSAIVTTRRPVFRGDLEAPVMVVQSEGDILGYLNSSAVRQPDDDRYRLWEVAGTAHADAHLLGSAADMFDCGAINDGPMHLAAKAALHALVLWVQEGSPPPTGDRLEVEEGELVRDADGIAIGGIRTPPVDVPVDLLSGEQPEGTELVCFLFGSTTPLPDARIAELYPSREDYEGRYEASSSDTIDAGFVLEADRAALLDYAQPERVGP